MGCTEQCLHGLDLLDVVFVVCCCNHSEAFVSLFLCFLLIVFMVENVDSQVYVLIKKDITFCTRGFKVGNLSSETKLQK